jgi:hypothetical protein
MSGLLKTLPASGGSALAALAAAFALAFAAPAQAGTTHYWTWHKAPTPEQLEACAGPMRKLVGARAAVLSPETAAGLAAAPGDFGPALFSLNGIGDFRSEQFVWPGRRGFNFCKTLGLPYDEVVTAVLIAARDCFAPAQLGIGTDGDWEEWGPGARLYESVLSKRALSPLGGEVQAPEGEVAREARDAGDAKGLLVRRETLDWLPAALLVAFVLLFAADRLRPRRIE